MAKRYIDADLLRKDIEFAKSVYDNPKRVVHGVADAFRQDGRAAMCDDILKKIDSLQQEQQEVDLEKEMEKFGERWPYPASFDGYDKDWVDELAEECAKHFYELGKKAMKEQMLKDAVEADVNTYKDPVLSCGWVEFVVDMPSSETDKFGDKVRIIIVKEEEE